jgi:Protein of unknown function (DUF2587)
MTKQEHTEVEHGTLVPAVAPEPAATEAATETIGQPGKVMRIGSMVKQLLDEVRAAPLDDASRHRLAAIYDRSVAELATALSPDLQNELRNLAHPFGSTVFRPPFLPSNWPLSSSLGRCVANSRRVCSKPVRRREPPSLQTTVRARTFNTWPIRSRTCMSTPSIRCSMVQRA